MKCTQSILAAAALTASHVVQAQSTTSCAAPSPSGAIKPSVASGYRLQVVATGLSKPRGILLDIAGNLLVVQQGTGLISAHSLQGSDGCITVARSKNLTPAMQLNHGIELSSDGKTLYASNTAAVYQWDYNATTMSVSNQVTLIGGMNGSDHTTRTLLLSRKNPGMLIVSRGSTSNLDVESETLDSGHSQVKAFNLLTRGSIVYDYTADGTPLGWGLRNEVGIAEQPNTGGIWGVENSADNIMRYGVDVHTNNPAEELNFLGYAVGTGYAQEGGNYGYPWCFTAWDPSGLPMNGNISVGDQFAISATSDLNNQNKTDAYCAQQLAPRLAFQAHMAPLDIKFNNSGTQAWVTFHGSWNRDPPVGYKLSLVQFGTSGEPTEPSTSTTAAIDIVSNMDNTACPGNCLRPVSVALASGGRIFMSSDASGEIYLVTKDGSSIAAPSGTTPARTTTSQGATSTANAATSFSRQLSSVIASLLLCLGMTIV